MQAARKRRVLNHRDIVLFGDFSDLQRQIVDALGDAERRGHARFIFQGHRKVGRVGDHHRGFRHAGHHALAAALHAQLPQLAP